MKLVQCERASECEVQGCGHRVEHEEVIVRFRSVGGSDHCTEPEFCESANAVIQCKEVE